MLVRGRAATGVLASLTVAVIVAAVSLLAFTLSPAQAAGPSDGCTPPSVSDGQGGCIVQVGASSPPSSSSTGGGGGGGGGCLFGPSPIPCQAPAPLAGWWEGDPVDCWVSVMNPQPGADDLTWAGHKPGDGVILMMMCPGYHPANWTSPPAQGFGQWFQNPPIGPAPSTLAAQALAQLTLSPPAIQMGPCGTGKQCSGATALVGLPVWFWFAPSNTTWGPQSKTVSSPTGGLTVTVTAKVQKVVWDTGDGNSISCTDPGTQNASPGSAYEPSFGNASSPTCGHTYGRPSGGQSGGAYKITATSTWVASWTASDGQVGSITDTTSSSTTLKVGELQVLNH